MSISSLGGANSSIGAAPQGGLPSNVQPSAATSANSAPTTDDTSVDNASLFSKAALPAGGAGVAVGAALLKSSKGKFAQAAVMSTAGKSGTKGMAKLLSLAKNFKWGGIAAATGGVGLLGYGLWSLHKNSVKKAEANARMDVANYAKQQIEEMAQRYEQGAVGKSTDVSGGGEDLITAGALQPSEPTVQLPNSGVATSKLVGNTIELPGLNGQSFKVVQEVGSGFSSLEQANNAAQSVADSNATGVNLLRYVVIKDGSSFHAVVAQGLDSSGSTAAKPTLKAGEVVAWNAVNFSADDTLTGSGWTASKWSKENGLSTSPFEKGANPFSVTASGPQTVDNRRSGVFNPQTVLRRTFAVNASVVGQSIIPGGYVQIQSLLPVSNGGFGTAEQAAVAARQATSGNSLSNPYSRVISLQGADGKFYLYQGSLVARATAGLENSAPMHVFGRGFASYFDGSAKAWQSVSTA